MGVSVLHRGAAVRAPAHDEVLLVEEPAAHAGRTWPAVAVTVATALAVATVVGTWDGAVPGEEGAARAELVGQLRFPDVQPGDAQARTAAGSYDLRLDARRLTGAATLALPAGDLTLRLGPADDCRGSFDVRAAGGGPVLLRCDDGTTLRGTLTATSGRSEQGLRLQLRDGSSVAAAPRRAVPHPAPQAPPRQDR